MSEIFNAYGNLLFVKDSVIQFVSSEKQNLLYFRISIVISQQTQGSALCSKGKFFTSVIP